MPPPVDAVTLVNLPAFAEVDVAIRDFVNELSIFGTFSDLSTLLVVVTISTAVELKFFGLRLREGDVTS
jgi:hypothetical protein